VVVTQPAYHERFEIMKTHTVKAADISHEWFVVDAAGQVLGRLASRVATILHGKHKPTYSPHLDLGDYVVVVNAEQVQLTGRKLEQKTYFHHTGYPGGGHHTPVKTMLKKKPEEVVRLAVRGMLPKTKLGRAMLKKLKVYRGAEHPHAAQNPAPLATGPDAGGR
jgi:large subunit ribosomal protein L13